MSNYKLSIVALVYNLEEYLPRCLDSLVSQTLEDIEILCVDDGSKDSAPQIIDEYAKKYPNKVKAFHKENGGEFTTRNYGLERATGEYITFVDTDDYVEPDWAEKLYNAFPVLRYHNSWKQVFPQKMHATYKGFGISSKVRPYTGPADYMNPPEGAPTVNPKDKDKVQNIISRANRRDFDAIRKTCEKHGIQLILYSAPSPKNYNIQRCDALAKLAKKTNVPYVDLNRRVEELQIDWATDTRDR